MSKQPRSFRVTAIVLRQKEVGEADRILSLYTHEKGKLSAIAKGVRKIRSRKAGHLEPFTLVSLQLAAGRDLYIISQAEAQEMFTPLRTNLSLMGYASYIVELVDRFTYDGEENPAIFRLLKDSFTRLVGTHDPEVCHPAFSSCACSIRLAFDQICSTAWHAGKRSPPRISISLQSRAGRSAPTAEAVWKACGLSAWMPCASSAIFSAAVTNRRKKRICPPKFRLSWKTSCSITSLMFSNGN